MYCSNVMFIFAYDVEIVKRKNKEISSRILTFEF